MPTIDDFGFCGPTYQAISRVIDASRSINLYPEAGLSTSKSKYSLIGAPGLQLFATCPTSPVRGLHASVGRLFACAGNKVFEYNSLGGIITDYGTIPGGGGSGPVQFVQSANTSGGGGGQLALMDRSVPAIFNITRASDSPPSPTGTITNVLANAWALEYLDGFFFALGKDGTTQNQVSQSASLDVTTWPALAIATKTGTPDLALNLVQINNQLWIFSQKNIEVWDNAGASPFALERVDGSTINIGLLAQYSVAKGGNIVFWLGASERGTYQVYRNDGLLPVRISPPAIEDMIASYGLGTSGNSQVTAFTYEHEGHIFYCLVFPSSSVNLPQFAGNPFGSMLVYDLATNMWHERAFLNVDGVTLERPLYHVHCNIANFGGNGEPPVSFVGAYGSGKIYKMALQFPSDDGAQRTYQRTAPHVSDTDRWMKYPSLVLSADCGAAQIALDYSNDGGRTFTVGPYTIGPSGEVPARYKWNQLGRSRDRVFRVKLNSNTELVRFINAYVNINPGTEP